VKQETSPDGRSHNAIAVDALQEARGMPPGARRTDALKKASTRCRQSGVDRPEKRQAPE
jgi:hypothetical protein